MMRGLFVSLFLTGFCQAVRVYLHPDPHVPPRLPATKAGAVLSKHLDLERFEASTPFVGEQELLFGGASGVGLLLTVDSKDAKDVIPHSMKHHSFSISPEPSRDSLSTLIPTYTDRANHVYSFVHESREKASEFLNLKDFLEGDHPQNRFGAFDFTSIVDIKESSGPSHEQVHAARQALHEMLSGLVHRDDVKLALVSVPSNDRHHKGHGHEKRQPPQSPLPPPIPHPAEPIDSVSTCYTSADTCGNATSSCSGHGECVSATKAGKTCFVCACSATKDSKGRKELWAGNACERKDVSGPFVLLAGTTVALLLLVFGSVALLSGVGGEKLPSTLTGGVGHTPR